MDRTKNLSLFWSILIHFVIVSGKDINLVFLVEPVQNDIVSDISATIQDVEQFHYGKKLKDNVLVVTGDTKNDIENLCNILSENVAFVIDFSYQPWMESSEFMNSIPYIRVDLIISPFLKIFANFLKEKSANDVALIFENEQDTEEALYRIVQGYPFRVVLVNSAENDFIKRLENLRPTPSYFAIFSKTANMNLIFENIQKAKIFSRPKEWHFIFLDSEENNFKYNEQVENSTKFSINAKELCEALEMQENYCASELKIQKAILLEIMKSIQKFSEATDMKEIEKFSCYKSIPYLTDFDFKPQLKLSKFLTLENNLLSYDLNMSINTFSNDPETKTNVAIWQAGELKKINATISSAKRFFRIGTAESLPWSYYKTDDKTGELLFDENGKPVWEGYCIDFIEILSKYMNFEYELVPPRSGLFGNRLPNGSWDGVVGDLVTGDTDFAVAALKMTSEREEVIDYIAPYYEQTGISIVIRKAVRQTSLFKFMTVLRLEVWLSIVAALVATAIMIWLLDKYSPYSAKNNKDAYPYPCREFTLKESFWFALTSFTPQGGGEAPKAISGRVLVAAYWLFVVLMLATFTANLAAFLTVERMQTPVQSLDQLARQSRINYTVVEGSDTHSYFINMKYAEDTLYRLWKELSLNATSDQRRYRIWDYPIKEQYGHILLAINSSIPVKDAAEGFRKVNEHENADFAFIHDSAEIKYQITKNCNLTEVGEVFAEQPYAIAVQQGSHLSDEISYAILELQRDRYFEGLSAKYWNNSLNKECSRSEDEEGITLESLGGVFIATLFGLALAMITLAAEVVYYKKKNKNNGGSDKIGVIKEVKPINSIAGSTPPPTFEVATFRGRKIPDRITLGDEFKPVIKRREKLGNFVPQSKDFTPKYYE
ncbi:glutamate receptor ionotropic, kainate 3 [Episyrphus balteatus]|uniref:glutamate receptor ionotropic, kainate 3 n=1 Tax=Episyrphus balteatus TaxID=286459 RepID=UPI00248584AF|nr:glutamate receptor ionotropic, kainate 3 [Episyrphus balteatus]